MDKIEDARICAGHIQRLLPCGSALEEQFETFDREGSVSFEVLDDLIGTKMNKGLLWRLKDTAHLLFRNEEGDPLSGRFLDWGMGYIFHEAFKLREDAYQNLNYAPLFLTCAAKTPPCLNQLSDRTLSRLLSRPKKVWKEKSVA